MHRCPSDHGHMQITANYLVSIQEEAKCYMEVPYMEAKYMLNLAQVFQPKSLFWFI